MQVYSLKKIEGSFNRTVSTDETLKRLMSRCNLYGITRVTDITGLDDLGISVCAAVRPRSMSSTSVHSGKGLSLVEAKVSAIAEAIEVDCAERFRPSDIVVGTYNDLKHKYNVFRPSMGVPGGRGVPPDLELPWVWVDNLLGNGADARGLLPLDFILQGSVGHEPGALFKENFSHGLASGNVLEEAIVHALYELIERDAFAVFVFRTKYCSESLRRKWYRIRLDSLPPRVVSLIAKIRSAGREVSLVDATSDVGIATVMCSISGACGIATSLSAEVAVLSAITEAAQTSTINRHGSREDLAPGFRNPRMHEPACGFESIRAFEVLGDPLWDEIPFCALPSHCHDFVDEDLDFILNALCRIGIQHVFCCDISDNHCENFRVVRIVIPELETPRLDTVGLRRLRYVL